jgi:hypothetical protein
MKQTNIRLGNVSDYLHALMTVTKAKKFRAGFVKKRTTNADEYILAHDLDKKAPRNISVARLKWFSVGKKVYKINHLEVNDSITVVMFEKVKFTALKNLIKRGDING